MNKEVIARSMLIVLVALGTCYAVAQESSGNALAEGLSGIARSNLRNLISAAESMPEEHYGFRPAADARSFAELVAHAVDSNRTFCSAAQGSGQAFEPTAETAVREGGRDKDSLIEELLASSQECDEALSGTSSGKMHELVELGGGTRIDGRPVPRGRLPMGALVGLFASHTNLHYGNMATYLRMKGIVPPTTRETSN